MPPEAETDVPPETGVPPGADVDHDGPGAAPDRPAWAWWVALGLAVAFLVGCIGFAWGREANRPEAGYSDVDRGFLADMSSHHDQAVEMALLVQGRTGDPSTESFAKEVVAWQRWELGRMEEMLAQAGWRRPDDDPQRTTMAWMGMPTPLQWMPGMASPEQMDALRDAEGREAAHQFLTLMRAHHQGGVHMAQEAAQHASDPRVRELAEVMARNQAIEVNEYTLALQRLGLE